jgi:hypothetical protein
MIKKTIILPVLFVYFLFYRTSPLGKEHAGKPNQ